jgi:membrane protease YdiL (CAAX protease family)
MIKKMFLNQEESRLRAGWRIIIFIFFYLALSRILNEVSFKVIGRLDRTTWSWWVVRGFLVIITSTFVVWIVRKHFDRKSFISLGLRLDSTAVKDFFVGLGISALMIGMLFVVFLVFGFLEIKEIGWSSGGISPVFGILFWFFGIGLAVGWSEELAFRGYLLQNMKDGMGIWWAVLLSCMLYGLLHMSNPNSSILSGVLIAIIGFVRIFGWLRTGQLWLSIGMHAGWDFFQGSIFGFTVSGMKTESLIKHTTSGASWITGGSFGPEAGILVIPVVILGLIIMYVWTGKRENTPWKEKKGEVK